ncbi:leucine--tRNA ligase [Catalinimonas niigatensis]|uniref:leucine--tRNA ligase n=1 Tax=Catalinimonas niigatensis TaxID=1397264 RepID=UPI0026665489|nr:class I tRNA ligase family protein [Catalinimonas niigatensis]WPP51269.1 class I tRNA ligase family protein [Catalinimonas niigatensis]
MAEYDFREIEKKWQKYWEENETYKVQIDTSKPKFYALDMFPYPSGAGLHVGHPLGYIASDIVSRYKRLKGYNVLHPMGFDAFGLPAEQYAIQTGQHPAITTENNIKRYKEQLNNIGFSFDWDKEVQTCDPSYYKWTQWIFLQLFHSWYSKASEQAKPIEQLIHHFEKEGNQNLEAVCDEETPSFTAEEWKQMDEQKQQLLLLKYRLTYVSDTVVNWCPELGTVLANDEVKDGFSERGGFPVERRKMKQWMMRITAFADRLLSGLDTIDWSDSLKEMQRNWIGKSYGCELDFKVKDSDIVLTAFTTRSDTIFGVTYVTLAPEHELIAQLTTAEQKQEVEAYVEVAKNRSERERMADVKTVSGVFTGSYVTNPINGEEIPLWVADYVLAGYGTGVVMAVPSSDDRDFRFANHFNLPIRMVIEGTEDMENPTEKKHGKMINSDFLNGMESTDAILAVNERVEKLGVGKPKVNYRMRDAVFSRQRYWGEPVPMYFKDGIPYPLNADELPLNLPSVDEYKPTATGEPPLGRAVDWKYHGQYEYELTTMPGWAGSSWYHFRYMDPHNEEEMVSKTKQSYWENVDLYIGGTEHATGHLLYSRFWTKFLYDRGYITVNEPYKKLVNQGMIQGVTQYRYKFIPDLSMVKGTDYSRSSMPEIEVSLNIVKALFERDADAIEELRQLLTSNGLNFDPSTVDFKSRFHTVHTEIKYINEGVLNLEEFKKSDSHRGNNLYLLEDGKFLCESVVEKMSKRLGNVVNPDEVVEEYGADTLRMYEMFLGPLEQSKPWNTNGIDGVFKFLRKLWRLFYDDANNFLVKDEKATDAELKILHKTIKKAQEDIENLSFNTSVSSFMICVNELTSLKCHKREVLTDLVLILSPYAPHIAEELWHSLGHDNSIVHATFPQFQEEYLIEASHEYPISVNGKVRAKMEFALDMPKEDIEKAVLASDQVQKWTEGKPPKRVIIVPKKIVNIVV